MRYDGKATFFKYEYIENELGDPVPKPKPIGNFDVLTTPFTHEEIQLFGLNKINTMTKVLCKNREVVDSREIEFDKKLYKITRKNDYKKVILFYCELIESES
ncbi:hypothetical protein CLPU_3c00830 [Gottschalkia purinilytica]|uniref:Phage head-tail adaptor n=1 Tax=Gottschalkia purinilytica TaxID=1503 RepID=A0A0L0WD11_GOTPU|nr:hypothetical protein [Gottschalkia purinilytica]KNF09305.1 hypothetical protein CLPU_3c00830 [Gottschalkia purinilytica]